MRTMKTASALAILAFAGGVGAQTIKATIDGEPVQFRDVHPMMMNGRVMVPLRGIFEEMGATVRWDPMTRNVTAEVPGSTVRLSIGNRQAWVDGSEVSLDAPPTIVRGRTMVPLRFISESLGNEVYWAESTRTVEIATGGLGSSFFNATNTKAVSLEARTVIPFRLDGPLNSDTAYVGQKFTATLDTDSGGYLGVPMNTQLEGHVETVRQRDGSTPGVLGLAFDAIQLPDGRRVKVYGSLSALDNGAVERKDDGRLVAKNTSKNDLKYVGYGAGGGALITLVTKGNVLTSTAIGAALGYLYGELKKDNAHDVHLKSGTEFGVRLDRDLTFRTITR